ncbi:multidrug transporter MatE [Lawsonella clevelandensis]|uniref:MATE family efflux transporter n=1 Tax=Lawsonella clevelandensis TaxID=1528099 RepID=UPI0006B63451|nr:MATE family efflux transporter [Lawsonella clevelandensis]ALE34187.1 multidrug transporter MatE [Lawsonella clevelandensis]
MPTPSQHLSQHLIPDLLRLALPALVVLAAEPLYVLFDTALVGHLGAVELAALAAGGTVLAVVSSQLTFLSYETTARSARFYGAGEARLARQEGVQASWLALLVGVSILVIMQIFLEPIAQLLTGGGELASDTVLWLRIALGGVPFILLSMAGNGWMRGVQEVRRPPIFVVIGFGLSAVLCPALIYGWWGLPALGLHGSAWANVVGQSATGLLFLVALIRTARQYQLSWKPQWSVVREQLHMGKDLIVRSLGFQVCFLSVSAVAARIGAETLAAHQIVWQIWVFTSLLLDSIAIAAQSLVGESLGAQRTTETSRLGRQIVVSGTLFATVIAFAYAALHSVIPKIFTHDSAVLTQASIPWWFMVCLLPVAGAVFACDGVLLGAGDAAFLRNVTAAAAFGCYLPMIWLSYSMHWGLAGLWSGFVLFIVVRAVAGLIRQRRGKWLIYGTPDALK